MKKVILTVSLIGMIAHLWSAEKQINPMKKKEECAGTITLSGAWALYPMAIKWAEEFKKAYPDTRFDISAGGAGKGMADALSGMVDIGMVSRDIYPPEVKKGAWWVSVAKDAVVPTINSDNPCAALLRERGMTRKEFADIFLGKKIANWSQLRGKAPVAEVRVYTRSDACGAAKTWAQYLGGHQEDLGGVGVFGDPGIAEAVHKDILGIGYNNINFAFDPRTERLVDGLMIPPLDLDGDGKISKDESFYDTRKALTDAIASGKYPSPPARDLHFVCRGKPSRPCVRAFLAWVLTDGQKFIPENGYICLPKQKLTADVEKLKED